MLHTTQLYPITKVLTERSNCSESLDRGSIRIQYFYFSKQIFYIGSHDHHVAETFFLGEIKRE